MTIYSAIAQFGGKDAGHVADGRTKDEARRRGRALTTMTIKVKRVVGVSASTVAALVAIGKLDS